MASHGSIRDWPHPQLSRYLHTYNLAHLIEPGGRRNIKSIPMLQRYCYIVESGVLLLATSSHGFAPVGRWKSPVSSLFGGSTTSFSTSDEIPSSPLSASSNIAGKHFQLEELEDAEKCTTDILLNSDMTVTVGSTDGPFFSSSYGTWSESTDESSEGRAGFEMKLSRTYTAGGDSKDATDIGEFTYEVERTFSGSLTIVGGTLAAMEGVILDIDELFGTREVGFFNMIDTTEARDADSVQ